jgi:Metallo-beta-lactamase superfamily
MVSAPRSSAPPSAVQASSVSEVMSSCNIPFALICFRVLAGDFYYLINPSGKNVLIDCGFHKGSEIGDAIDVLPGRPASIILTHQHVDHFGGLNLIAPRFGIEQTAIMHSGFSLPPGHVPRYPLSTCEAYEGTDVALWLTYHQWVHDRRRWESFSIEDVEIENLIPDLDEVGVLSDTGDIDTIDLNMTATPVLIRSGSTRIVIASDVPPRPLRPALSRRDLGRVSLFGASSHGRPSHNPPDMVCELRPRYICLSDSFPRSDFRQHYFAMSIAEDIRSTNIDGSQIYFFDRDGSMYRSTLLLDGHQMEAEAGSDRPPLANVANPPSM